MHTHVITSARQKKAQHKAGHKGGWCHEAHASHPRRQGRVCACYNIHRPTGRLRRNAQEENPSAGGQQQTQEPMRCRRRVHRA
jgi:hypothetical protein